MRAFRDLPIRRKLTLITLAISVTALLVACGAFAFYEQAQFRRNNARDFAILADMFDDNVASGLAFNDPASIEPTLHSLRANASIMAACVYDNAGNVVASYRRPDLAPFAFPAVQNTGQVAGPDRLDTFKRIVLGGEPIGTVYIASDLQELRDRAAHYVVVVGVLLLGCSLVALVLVAPLQRLISQPIVDLAQVATTVAAGDFSRRAVKRSADEVGRLVDAFNEMLGHIQARNAQLQQARDELEQRVEERTAELQLENAERRRSEQALRESNRRFEIVTRATSDAVWDWDVATGSLWWNENFQSLFGYGADAVPHSIAAWESFLHPDDLGPVSRSLQEALDGPGTLWSMEYRFRREDGPYAYVFDRGYILRDAANRPVRVIGAMQNISERKLAELAAAREHARFKFIFESVPIGFSWMIRDRPDTRISNPALALITGVATAPGRQLEDYLQATHPDDRSKQEALHAALLAGDIDHYELEKRYLHGDGSVRWAQLTVKFYRDELTGEVQEIRTTIDITDRKRAAEELRWKTAFLEALVESPLFGLRVVDPQGRMIFQNARTVQLWKIPAEIKDDEEAQLHFLGQIERPAAFLGRLKNVGQAETTQDEIKLRDGTVIDRYSAPVTGRDGRHYGRIFAYQDITERKQAEARLAETSALLETLLAHAPDFIYFKDLESRFVHFSGAFAAQFRLADVSVMRGKTDFDFYTEEHARPAYEDEQRIIRTGRPIVGQLEKETHPDGRITWGLTTKLPWRNAEGRIIGTFGISKDVTALKEAEAKAMYERDLLQTLMDRLPDAIYFKDRQSRFLRVSRSHAEIAWHVLRTRHAREHPGVEPPGHLRSIDTITPWLMGRTDFETFGDELARTAFDEEQAIVRTGEPVVGRIERLNLANGTTVWYLVNKMPWRDKDGQIIGTFGSSHNITALKDAEAKLAATHKQLLEISRQAGMAEVATGVLHNVGNVLNSVNVSATLLADLVRQSKMDKIDKLSELIASQQHNLAAFFTEDPRGQKIPGFLQALSSHLTRERADILKELEALRKNIEHIKDIVAMQQNYAKVSGVCETVPVVDLVEDALRMNSGAFVRHEVSLLRDFQAAPTVTVEKHKVLQILINLMRNAKYACDESGRPDKQMVVRITAADGRVRIEVIDNGVGIPPENLTRIFSHGFTTRKHGHGFGLHSCALAARELGGSLVAHSDGPGRGAIFTLELPHKSEARAA